MSHVAIVKTVSDGVRCGRWTFAEGDTPEEIRVVSAEGLSTHDQELLDSGEVRNLQDFLRLVVGGRGTMRVEWVGGSSPLERPTVNDTLAELRRRGSGAGS